MMAKMFYTLDEAKAALGKNEEEIKQLAREGKLREFRDGARLMFKADQVDALKSQNAGLDQVDLGPSDSGTPIGLIDSKGASGTSITLSDSDAGGGSSLGMPSMKEDTALAADLGLTGSQGGVPSPNRSGIDLSGSQASRSGIEVLQPEDAERADPGAQTSISSSVSDQVNLEGTGSGSGLLDLTRESDDTSLGADLLDEIQPGGSKRAAPAMVGTQSGIEGIQEARIGRGFGAPVYVEAADWTAPAFGGAALGGVAMLLFSAFVITSAVLGTQPDIINQLAEKGLWFLFGAGLAVAAVLAAVGLVIGKASR